MQCLCSHRHRGVVLALHSITFDNSDLFVKLLNVDDPILSIPPEVLFLLIESPLQSASVYASGCSGSLHFRIVILQRVGVNVLGKDTNNVLHTVEASSR